MLTRFLPLLLILVTGSHAMTAGAQDSDGAQRAQTVLMLSRMRHAGTSIQRPDVRQFATSDALDAENARRAGVLAGSNSGAIAGVLEASKSGVIARAPAGSNSGAIAGRVSGLSPRAMESAAVMAWTADSAESDFSTSYAKIAPDSTFMIEGLASGTYYVMAYADGYVPMYYDGVADASYAVIVAVAESSVGGIDFAMEAVVLGTGSISGTVRAESDGGPVADVDVYAFDPDSFERFGYATTDPDGSYSITDLKSGSYIVQVYAYGYLPEYFDNADGYEQATFVEVVEPERSESIDFSLSVGGSISGTVRGADGLPLAGAYLQAMVPFTFDSTQTDADGQTQWYSGWAVSDENGFYRMDGLYPAEYLILAQMWTRWSFAYQWYDRASVPEEGTTIEVGVGEERSGIDFELSLPAANSSISGTVVDESGDPLPEVFVTAERIQDESSVVVWAYSVTDKSGNYSIDELPSGDYRVSASAQVGWQYIQVWYLDAPVPEEATPISLAEGERVANIDLQLPAESGAATISGVVLDTDGAPLYGAFLEVTSKTERTDDDPTGSMNLWAYGMTDSSGAYQVDHLPPGSYVVHASYWSADRFGQGWYDGADSPEAATAIDLLEEEDRPGIDFRISVRPMYGTVEGTVTTEAGEPIHRAYVELTPVSRDLGQDAPLWFMSTHAITDEKGRFRIEWISEGSFVAAVYSTGAMEYFDDASTSLGATPIRVIGGSVTSIDVSLTERVDGEGVITGTVTSEDYGGGIVEPGFGKSSAISSPLEIAVVVAQPVVDSGVRYVAVTTPDGAYRLGGMAPGDYVVSTFAPGYVGEYYDDAYSPEEAATVHVDGVVDGISFRLWPIYYMSPELDAGRASVVVHGTVTDESGKAVEGATVYVLNESEQPVASMQTGPDGRFEMTGLVAGSYRIYAGKLGFSGSYNGNASDFAAAEPISIHGGQVEVNLVLAGTSTRIDDDPSLPHEIELIGNYPNPFNPETTILFRLAQSSDVRLVVYDVLGSEIAVLVDGHMAAGPQSVRWNATNRSGRPITSGVYFYRLDSGSVSLTGRMTLLR